MKLNQSSFRPFPLKEIIHGNIPLQMGDILLGNRNNIHDNFIHWATKSQWNHAALIINAQGDIVEMNEFKGIQKGTVYTEKEDVALIIKTDFTDEQREQIGYFVAGMLDKKIKFSYLSLLDAFLHLIIHSPLIVKISDHMTCSEFVANALIRTGYDWDKDPALVTPQDIYTRFKQEAEAA